MKKERVPTDAERAAERARVLSRALFAVRGMSYPDNYGESSLCLTDSDDTLTGEQLDNMRGKGN